MKKLKLGILLLAFISCASCNTPENLADEIVSQFDPSAPPPITLDIIGDSPSPDASPNDFVDDVILGSSSRMNPRLPNYSYYQGIIHARNHLIIAGQVRVVGAVLGTDLPDATVSLYRGAMITTNPDAFTKAGNVITGGAAGVSTRASRWEEVPTP